LSLSCFKLLSKCRSSASEHLLLNVSEINPEIRRKLNDEIPRKISERFGRSFENLKSKRSLQCWMQCLNERRLRTNNVKNSLRGGRRINQVKLVSIIWISWDEIDSGELRLIRYYIDVVCPAVRLVSQCMLDVYRCTQLSFWWHLNAWLESSSLTLRAFALRDRWTHRIVFFNIKFYFNPWILSFGQVTFITLYYIITL